ncbi:MAG: PHP-associated domain-containing protein [Nanoarchaeota archaeon]
MNQAPEINGQILADLHCHPSRNYSVDEIVKKLSEGITGLIPSSHGNFLSYEDVLTLPGAKELEKGLFAEIHYGAKTGYVLPCQEINASFHIPAVGCKKMLPSVNDARKAVELIHKESGLAVLNHPYVVSTDRRIIRYRLVNDAELKAVEDLCGMVDEIEAFNAQNINLLPSVAWMKQANGLATALATKHGFHGIASSDAHRLISQVRTAGIWVPSEYPCIDSLMYSIMEGDFTRHRDYVSIPGFLKGMFFS